MLCNLTLITIFQTRYLHFTDLNRLRDLTSLPEITDHKWQKWSFRFLSAWEQSSRSWVVLFIFLAWVWYVKNNDQNQDTHDQNGVLVCLFSLLLVFLCYFLGGVGRAQNYTFCSKICKLNEVWNIVHTVEELVSDLLADYIICIPYSTHITMHCNKQ